jgi:hypothetical protein
VQPDRHVDPVSERRQRLRERARAEYIAGAEDEHRRLTGQTMTAEELERVLRRYPGTCSSAPVRGRNQYSPRPLRAGGPSPMVETEPRRDS